MVTSHFIQEAIVNNNAENQSRQNIWFFYELCIIEGIEGNDLQSLDMV